ncbi:MAG TPA: trehalose-phosphatase [Rhodospirillaceae bacterium]|nr:trehalose-phosphatase [Rhodospirillaceae bacterium]
MPIKIHPDQDALFLDIDGTLLDIAPSAEEVVMPKQLIKDLGALYGKLGGALALISGRTIADIDHLFKPLRLPCSGAQGAEWRLSPDSEIQSHKPLPSTIAQKITDAFGDIKGVRVEDKGYTVAVHYRQAVAQVEEIEEILTSVIKAIGAKEIVLVRGRKVVEVLRAGQNKGMALERFLKHEPFKGRRPAFLGDDDTDISAIGASLKNGGIAARVGRGKKADNAFASPDSVRAWLNVIVVGKAT